MISQLLKNKTFRKLDLFPYSVWTCWGRVGERGHGVTSDSGLFEIALKGFQKKFKERTGIPWDSRFEHPIKGKYTVIERNFDRMPYQSVIDDLSSSYYTYIPHCSGRHRLPMIDNHGILRKEVKLLESLSDMSIADDIMKEAKEDSMSTLHPLDRQYALLGMAEMTPCRFTNSPDVVC